MCPELDVWLPAFNAEATLAAAVESVRRQTFRDWRLLLVDDGSTDRTPEIAAGLAARDERIRVLRIPHGGIVAALLAAAAASDASRFARMDADDLAHPRRFERQLASSADIVGARTRITGAQGQGMNTFIHWQNSLLTHEDHVRELFVESPLAHPTALVRRSAYDRAGGYRVQDGPEDYDLWIRMWETGARFEKVPRILLDWSDAPGRLTRSSPDYSEEAFRRVKLAHLARHPVLRGGRVTVWGAGPVGRRWMRDLRAIGIEVACAIDIDPRKIGRVVAGGVRILTPEDAFAAGTSAVLGAVGSRGARAIIRRRLLARKLVEGADFLFLA